MKYLYNIGIACYKLFVSLAGCFNGKAKKLAEGQRTVFTSLRGKIRPEGGYIWIHASSLGEFEQGRPLIEALQPNRQKRPILLTFFSPSGYEVRKNYEGADCISYLPLDQPANVSQFLDMVKPTQAIFIKYEFWSNYLHQLKDRHIPVYIISAIFRPSQIFFRPYGKFFRNMLLCFTHLYVQDEASRTLLANIGISNVTVAGDTRFDRVIEISKQSKNYPLIEQFCNDGFIWIAGSTWPKDEEIIIRYFNNRPGQKLIIAPHEIHESHLQQIERLLKRPALRFSQATAENIKQAECLIIDSFGMLSSLYRYGKLAYIGGGFGVGIHNILEAAVFSQPVIFGPNFSKFREARQMVAEGCAFTISQYNQLEYLIDNFSTSPDVLTEVGSIAEKYIANNSGATATIYNGIYKTQPIYRHQ